jgi:YebC/PmpR family DNA-binding regulatory protein
VAGHSHWSKIKRQKGAEDARKGKVFSKHARLIMTAARAGGGDPDMNPRLRLAIDKAKADGMPKDNVERAVKKGSGETGGAAFESVLYEGYLPGGVAILIDVLTDNRNRTAGEVRNLLERVGGNLASSGSVQWGFEQRAVYRVTAGAIGEDDLLERAMNAGADDLRREGDEFAVLAAPNRFAEVRAALSAAAVDVKSAEITYLPKSLVAVREVEVARKIVSALDALDDNDDVQGTITNFEMDDAVVTALAQG